MQGSSSYAALYSLIVGYALEQPTMSQDFATIIRPTQLKRGGGTLRVGVSEAAGGIYQLR